MKLVVLAAVAATAAAHAAQGGNNVVAFNKCTTQLQSTFASASMNPAAQKCAKDAKISGWIDLRPIVKAAPSAANQKTLAGLASCQTWYKAVVSTVHNTKPVCTFYDPTPRASTTFTNKFGWSLDMYIQYASKVTPKANGGKKDVVHLRVHNVDEP
ncbi:Aste57867_5946 [Aphanomyces stellatus]|uniref:Aste57867_5946 protein n=1 Tax=Aphanomyces stellatus TaxID=120398 RepID=A0A485KEX2_9STRA|nr:hypothetical protein As57867_005932 [Aphanomyces stellatus]VFT82963.1 Aste57867_5946 [Aphanomyces stellatus]